MSDEMPPILDDLCEDLKPCKPLRHPLVRMAPWLLLAPVYMLFIAVFVVGLRDDCYEMLSGDLKYQIDLGSALFLSLSSALVLGWVNLPDMRQQPYMLYVPALASMVFFGNIIYRFSTADYSAWEYDMDCFKDAVLLAFVPLVAIVLLVRKGCSSCHRLSALFAILAVSSLGWIGLRLTCNIDHIAQNFMLQFMPFVILGVVIWGLSGKLFRW